MLPDSTTTMGEEESVKTDRPFHSMKAVESTRAKLSTCAASWRGWRLDRPENILSRASDITSWGLQVLVL